jgi:Tol biopolymer transport system component
MMNKFKREIWLLKKSRKSRRELLTDGSSRNGYPNWSNDGKKFVYYSTKRNGRDWDIYLGDINTPGKAEIILEKGGTWVAVDWSPDDKKLLTVSAACFQKMRMAYI